MAWAADIGQNRPAKTADRINFRISAIQFYWGYNVYIYICLEYSEDRIGKLSPNDHINPSSRFGAGTPMLVDADGDYAHEFWEENKAPVCPAMVDLGNPF